MKVLRITAENRNQYENTSVKFKGKIEIANGLGLVSFISLEASYSIIAEAGSGIKAGWRIEAGSGIEAGWGIKAGEGIKAGSGIKAGWGIEAKWLSIELRIFAGLCLWRLPTPKEMEIKAKIKRGTVCFGNVVDGKGRSRTIK